MKEDQLKKLKAERNIVADTLSRKDKFHILSWTLTQQPEDVLNLDRAILNINAAAFDDLVEKAWNAFTLKASRMYCTLMHWGSEIRVWCFRSTNQGRCH